MRRKLIIVVLASFIFISSIVLGGTLSISDSHVKASAIGHSCLMSIDGHVVKVVDGDMPRFEILGKTYEGRRYDTPWGVLYDMYFYTPDGKQTGNLSIVIGSVTYSYTWSVYTFDDENKVYKLIFHDEYGTDIYTAMGWLAGRVAQAYISSGKTLSGDYKLMRNTSGDRLSPYDYGADDVFGPIKEPSMVFPVLSVSVSSCKGQMRVPYYYGVKVMPMVNVRNGSEERKVVGIGMFIRDDMVENIMNEYDNTYGLSHLYPQLVSFSSMNLKFGIYKDSLLGFINWATDRDSERFWNPTVRTTHVLNWIGAFAGVLGGADLSTPINILVSVVSDVVENFTDTGDFYVKWHVDASTGKMNLIANDFLPISLASSTKINNHLWGDLRYIPDTSFVPIYGAYDMGQANDHVAEVSGTVWLKVVSKVYWTGSGHSACSAIMSAPIYINMRFRAED